MFKVEARDEDTGMMEPAFVERFATKEAALKEVEDFYGLKNEGVDVQIMDVENIRVVWQNF